MSDEWELIEGWAEGDPFTYVNTRTGEVVETGDGSLGSNRAKDMCWSLGPDSDWCGSHDSKLNVADPNDPELLICQFVAHGFGHHEDLSKLVGDGGVRPIEAKDW